MNHSLRFLVVLSLSMVPAAFPVMLAEAVAGSADDGIRTVDGVGEADSARASSAEPAAAPSALEAFMEGGFLFEQGELGAAVRRFRQAAAADSTAPEIALSLARSYQRLGLPDSSLVWAEAARRLEPSNGEAAFLGAFALRLLGRAPESLEWWREAYRLEASNEAIRMNLVLTLTQLGEDSLRTGHVDRGEALLREAAAIAPDRPDALRLLWRIAMQKDRPAEADSLARTLMAITPPVPEAAVFRALALQRMERHEEAIALADSIFRADPARRDAGLLLAILFSDRGDFRAAADRLQALLQRAPEDREVRFRLAVALDQSGQPDSAMALLDSLIAEGPDDPRILNHAGYNCIDRGMRLAEALEWVRRAVELDPNNGAYLDSYGWGWYRLGEAEKALEPLARAAELLPGEVLILKHLGQAQEAAGELDDARSTYERALQLDPMDRELPVWLKRLENPPPRRGEHPTQ